MAQDLLLKEDGDELLKEDGTSFCIGGLVDYKFSSISRGTDTDCVVRFFTGSGSYVRDTIVETITETLSGVKTDAELVTYYNNKLKDYGEPISQQT